MDYNLLLSIYFCKHIVCFSANHFGNGVFGSFGSTQEKRFGNSKIYLQSLLRITNSIRVPTESSLHGGKTIRAQAGQN